MAIANNTSAPSSEDAKPVRRISTPAGQRLSVILENKDGRNRSHPANGFVNGNTNRHSNGSGGIPPVLPVRSPRRILPTLNGRQPNPDNNGFYGLENTPSNDDTKFYNFAPSVWSDQQSVTPSPPTFTDKLGENIRRKRDVWNDRRGGWRRLGLILLLLIVLLAVGLGVGLGVGLKNNGGDDESSQNGGKEGDHSGGTGSNSSVPEKFPVGKWAIRTFLDTVQTNCTSTADTWECYPGVTYYESPDKSHVVFNWIIDQDPDSPDDDPKYVIRSSPNLLSISFDNMPLKIYDQGTSNERYTFQFTTKKTVYPDTPLTNSNDASVCFFSTTFQATLSAKSDMHVTLENRVRHKRRDYAPWPYMAKVEQSASAGDGVPECYRSVGGKPTGDLLKINPASAGGLCSCYYRNWLTPSP